MIRPIRAVPSRSSTTQVRPPHLTTDEAFAMLTSLANGRTEQTKVVSELVEQARRSARHYRAAAIALTAVVALCALVLACRCRYAR